jgi:predicted RNA-binding protein with PIN domain
MRFLIDGYNLLHAIWPSEGRHLRARAWPRFRQRLLQRLHGQDAADRGAVTVVFDASRSPPGAAAEQDGKGILVRFAVGYPSADDLVEELIRSDPAPAQLTVVSDDRRLKEAARRRGCVVSGCLDYFESLGHVSRPQPTVEESPPKPERVAPDEVDHWLKEFGGTGGED